MFKCEDVLSELSEYLDDALSADIRKQLEEHIAHCNSCRALYDSTRKTLRIVTDSGSFELSEDLSSKLTGKILARLREKRPE